jgi:hypothetical protein
MHPNSKPKTIDQRLADNAEQMKQYQQFIQNPIQFLMSRNINIPQQFQNDPRGATQYLMNSGRMSQNQFNRLSQMVQLMGMRLT